MKNIRRIFRGDFPLRLLIFMVMIGGLILALRYAPKPAYVKSDDIYRAIALDEWRIQQATRLVNDRDWTWETWKEKARLDLVWAPKHIEWLKSKLSTYEGPEIPEPAYPVFNQKTQHWEMAAPHTEKNDWKEVRESIARSKNRQHTP